MLRPRVIPVLVMKDGRLIKPTRFSGGKYVGDPINVVKIFNEKEVDELTIYDISAWSGHGPDLGLLRKIAMQARMPLTYGGGITSVRMAEEIIGLGYEKISVGRAAALDESLIGQIVAAVGGQSIVATVDVREESGGSGYVVVVENGTRRVDIDPVVMCQRLEKQGVGELVVQSVDRESAGEGYDLRLLRLVRAAVSIPMTIVGGAGRPEHLRDAVDEAGVIGLGVGTMFVFRGPLRAVLVNYRRPDWNA